MSVKTWLQDKYSSGLAALKTTAAAAGRTAVITTKALVGTDISNDPLFLRANDTIHALINETIIHDEIGFQLADGRTTIDQEALSGQLDDILLDLTDSTGSLNHQAAILNDSEAIQKLVEIVTVKGKYEERLQDASRKVLVKLLDHSTTRKGLLSTACPTFIKELITAGSLEDGKDYSTKLKKHTATVNFLNEIKRKNPNLHTGNAILEYITSANNFFYGAVGPAMVDFLSQNINEFLSDPAAILKDSDFDLNPNEASQLTKALGEFFESNIPKAFRNDKLVALAKELISTHEEGNRNSGSNTVIGTLHARENFVNALFNTSREVQAIEEEIQFLKQEKENIENAIKHKTQIPVHRDFCSPNQINGSSDEYIDISPDSGNLQRIDSKIRTLVLETQTKEVEFQKSKQAIRHALEASASPFKDGKNGLLDFFIDRLMGNSEAEKINDEERNFAEIIFGIKDSEDLDIDLRKISDSNYGNDFTGIKKYYLDLLRQRQEYYQRQLTIGKLNQASFNAEINKINDEYWNPLKEIAPLNRIIPTTLKDQIKNFSINSSLVEEVINKSNEANNKAQRIFDLLIYRNNEGKFVINEPAINSLGLNTTNHLALRLRLVGIADYSNSQTSAGYQPAVTNFPYDFIQIMKLIKEGSNLDLIASNDFPESEAKELAILIKEQNEVHLDFLKKLSELIQYEKSASAGNEGLFADKLESLGLDETNIELVTTTDLNRNIERAQYFRTLNYKLDTSIKLAEAMLDLNSPDYTESWNKELTKLRNRKSIPMKLKDDLDEIGLNTKGAQKLQEQMIDLDNNFSFSDNEGEFAGFVDIIRNLIQNFMRFLSQVQETR